MDALRILNCRCTQFPCHLMATWGYSTNRFSRLFTAFKTPVLSGQTFSSLGKFNVYKCGIGF